jgi:hypothetical protein
VIPLDDDARACGISKEALEATARVAVSKSKVRLVGDSPTAIFVAADVIKLNAGCVASVRLSVVRYSREFENPVVVWSHQELLTGSPETFGKRTRETVEEAATILVGDWLKANPN